MTNRKDSRSASGTRRAAGHEASATERPSKFVRALLRDRKGTAGAILLLFFVVLAVFPGQIAPYSPTYIGFPRALGPSARTGSARPPRARTSTRSSSGARAQSLIIAVAAGGLATLISVLVGVSAAYLGGLVDGVLSLITDVLLVIPILPLIIVIAAYLRSAGLKDIIIVLGALGWSYGARQLRVQALSLRNRDFLTAAVVRGERSRYIIVAEILPTMTSLIVATFLGSAVFAVLTAAGLQFIGLGDPSAQSWGTMLYWAQNNEALGAGMPLWAIMPGVCIALLGGAFAFLNYAFDEISNPALRPVRRLTRKPAIRSDVPLRSRRRAGRRPAKALPSTAMRPRRGPGGCSRSAGCRWRTPPMPTRSSPSTTSISISARGSSSPWWASPGAGSRPSCSPSRSCWSSPRASLAGAWSSAAARWRR